MSPVIQRASKSEADDLPRTNWFGPDTEPTIPGEYEARTGGGHVFRRKWTENGWINSITGLISKAPLDWRGVQPVVELLDRYPYRMHTTLIVSTPAEEFIPGADALDIPFA